MFTGACTSLLNVIDRDMEQNIRGLIHLIWTYILYQHRGQTFAHARIVVRAELSARTKTEKKYISERLHKALEKRVNKITRW